MDVKVEKRYFNSLKRISFIETVDKETIPSDTFMDVRTSIKIPRDNPKTMKKEEIILVECMVTTPDGKNYKVMLNPRTLTPSNKTSRMDFGKFLQNLRT